MPIERRLQFAGREVLLIYERPVSGKKDINVARFGGLQKFAILEARPSHVGDGQNLVRAEQFPQSAIKVFIEKHP